MKGYIPRDIATKLVEKDVPCCPVCYQELDTLQMINGVCSCQCGTWTYGYADDNDDVNVILFKPWRKNGTH